MGFRVVNKMDLIKDKFLIDPPLARFTRNNYFSPLEPKYRAKPRISYYAKYLISSNERKSSSISPVNIKNYKELSYSAQSKIPKSCLYLKSIQIDSDKLEDSITPKLSQLPSIQKSLEVRSNQSPAKSPRSNPKKIKKKTSTLKNRPEP